MPEEEHTTICPQCGAAMKEWWQRLTPGIVRLLFEAIRIVKSKNENLILNSEIIKKPADVNFYKLRYFGLIQPQKDEGQNAIPGHWILTTNAGRFLRGEIEMPRRVKTFRNRLIEKDEQTIPVKFFYNRYPEFDSHDAFQYDIHPIDGHLTKQKSQQSMLL